MYLIHNIHYLFLTVLLRFKYYAANFIWHFLGLTLISRFPVLQTLCLKHKYFSHSFISLV